MPLICGQCINAFSCYIPIKPFSHNIPFFGLGLAWLARDKYRKHYEGAKCLCVAHVVQGNLLTIAYLHLLSRIAVPSIVLIGIIIVCIQPMDIPTTFVRFSLAQR